MEGRRRITLFDQMTAGNSGGGGSSSSRDSLASLMLDDVVFKKAEAEAEAEASRGLSRSRTLQDIIREEKPNNGSNNAKDRNSWKAFKERIRLKRAVGSAWSSTATSINHIHSNDVTNLPETRNDSDESTTQQNDVVVVVEETNDSDPITRFGSPADTTAAGGDSSDGENNHEAVVGVSLMDLLEEAEQEMDLYRVSDDADEEVATEYEKRGEEEKRGVEEEIGGVVEYNCCVCMVRHKGAAFIPCGHTFCRACSREIWVSRGNCPLCNNLILEILDIF